MKKQKLPFVTDEVLFSQVKHVITIAQSAVDGAVVKLHDSVVDPFSAIFDASRQGIGLSNWLEQEKARQIQKTLQNAMGDFHQAILGSVKGWANLGVGNVVDIKNDSRKLIAEIKNKYNTTKGNHKKVIYDDINNLLSHTYRGYTGYYVEIIPKSKHLYDNVFTPSDNETHERRPENLHIRVIDGYSFYALVTEFTDGLKMLYRVLPEVIAEIIGKDYKNIVKDPLYKELFDRAYPNSQ